jgi:hypothetical protein
VDLISVLSSSVVGTVLGAAGSFLTKREERETLKLTHAHELSLADRKLKEVATTQYHELALADKQIGKTIADGAVVTDAKFADAFVESQSNYFSRSSGVKVVDAVRDLMRPVISCYLLVIVTVLTVRIGDMVGGLSAITGAVAFDLYRTIILELIFLTSTCLSWWFGSRPSQSIRGIR